MGKGFISTGDLVVITAGVLTGIPGGTNIMKVHLVAKEIARGMGVGKEIVKGIGTGSCGRRTSSRTSGLATSSC